MGDLQDGESIEMQCSGSRPYVLKKSAAFIPALVPRGGIPDRYYRTAPERFRALSARRPKIGKATTIPRFASPDDLKKWHLGGILGSG